jgi:hypothetical protein
MLDFRFMFVYKVDGLRRHNCRPDFDPAPFQRHWGTEHRSAIFFHASVQPKPLELQRNMACMAIRLSGREPEGRHLRNRVAQVNAAVAGCHHAWHP